MPAKIRNYLHTVLKLLLIFLIAAGFATFWYFNTLPDRADAQQTLPGAMLLGGCFVLLWCARPSLADLVI